MSKTITKKRKIANFELNDLIGSGGMANIYKAIQISLERPIAIKLLHQHLTVNEDFVVRFENEAKQAAQLVHPNIVAIIDYGHYRNEYFIAMEYIDGLNLKEIMTQIKRFPLEIALLIAREVAEGLKYAHNNELIHRDIKPANIMLASDGRVVITDFGIAKNHKDMSITATGQMIGSPAYMSPEQAAARPADHRCDIFSLGIVMYEIITGEKPFKGDSYQEMITNIISGEITPPTKLRIDVTPQLENIIMKALKKDIESRYQDAAELCTDINRLLEIYVVQFPQKLIAEFLKNPIRTTEKLRADRISKHMESALYLVNLGHGRLEDAIKEFEYVLRFDKNNKTAREQLERLKTNKIENKQKTPAKIRKHMLWAGVLAGITALTIVLVMVFSGRSDNKSQDSIPEQVADHAIMGDIAIVPSPPDRKNARRTENISKVESKISKKLVTDKAKSKYNYPDQSIKDYGSLKIGSIPAAVFSVDAKEYGLTGGPIIKLTPGRHTIIIKAEGYKSVKKRIFTEKNKTQSLDVKLKPDK